MILKKINRCACFILSILLVFSLFPTSVFAAQTLGGKTAGQVEEDEYQRHKDLAVEFLSISARNEWLGEKKGLTKYIDEKSVGGQFALMRTQIMTELHKMQKETRSDFKADYNVEYAGPRNFDVVVRVVETITFNTGERQKHYSNTYVVVMDKDTLKINDVNKVRDWFETEYRYSGKTKEIILSEITKEIINNSSVNIDSIKDNEMFKNSATVKNTEYLAYNADNAINYALTYSGDNTNFYNGNYVSYSGKGGDCMNFVSQSIFAGLSGINDSVVQDTGVLFQEYSGDLQTGWVPRSYVWTSVNGFYQYVTSPIMKSNGLVVKTWYIKAGQQDLGIPENLLKGSIALVPGENKEREFGHAIIFTEINGTRRSDIRYSGHTENKYNASLGRDYKDCAMLIVRPIYYKLTEDCLFDGHYYRSLTGVVGGDYSECIWCGHSRMFITNKIVAPLAAGQSARIASKTSMNVFKMSIKITSPSGEETWLMDEYNTNYIKRQFVFKEPGLYRVDVYAQDVNDIMALGYNETSSSYYVRVSGTMKELQPGDSEYVDNSYYDNSGFKMSFAPNYEVG